MIVEGDEENAHFSASFQMFNPMIMVTMNI